MPMLEHLYKKTFQKRLVFLVLSKCLSMLYSETKLFVSFLTPSRFECYTYKIVIDNRFIYRVKCRCVKFLSRRNKIIWSYWMPVQKRMSDWSITKKCVMIQVKIGIRLGQLVTSAPFRHIYNWQFKISIDNLQAKGLLHLESLPASLE